LLNCLERTSELSTRLVDVRRVTGRRGLDVRLQVAVTHEHPPGSDPNRSQRTIVDPISDCLLIELELGRDLVDRQELI
jgi:hypothetical protein